MREKTSGSFELGPDKRRNTKGRPLSGRSKALALLDKICTKAATRKLFETALKDLLKEHPLTFFREFVVALAPKQVDVDTANVGFGAMTPAEQIEYMLTSTIGEKPLNPAEASPSE